MYICIVIVIVIVIYIYIYNYTYIYIYIGRRSSGNATPSRRKHAPFFGGRGVGDTATMVQADQNTTTPQQT